MAKADDGNLVGSKTLDYVVDRDVGGSADKDASRPFDKLTDELNQSVGLASLFECLVQFLF